jgi:RNA 3'-terminal phosphate cyclase (ATP)
MGEGGGQVLRTSLGLSLVTGQPFRIGNIRAGREKPGLLQQHLAGVRAAAKISSATVSGDEMGSQDLTFEPGKVRSGQYEFAVGTAGSATLVLQTVLPALMVADGPSELALKGGTHNPWAPPFDFLKKTFLPLLNEMGPKISCKLVRPGFYPAGGGEFRVSIEPAAKLEPLQLTDRGNITACRARVIISKLSDHIAQRELKVIARKLDLWPESLKLDRMDSAGPGNVVMIEIKSPHVTEVITTFGEVGVRAELIANQAYRNAKHYIAAEVPVGEHLADQLLLPLAMSAAAGGNSRFRTVAPTQHTTTNIDVIQKFLDVSITTVEHDGDAWEIDIRKS